MKILIVTPRMPYPPYRGDKLKIYNLAKHLSKSNEVQILTFVRNNVELADAKFIQDLGVEIECIRFPLWRSLMNMLFTLFSKKPFQVGWFYSPRMKNKIMQVLTENKFDAIYFHLIRCAQYLNSTYNSSALKIIDFTDAVSLYLKRYAEIEKNLLKKILIKIEQSRVASYERVAEKFDKLFICSEVDKKYLLENGLKADIGVLRNGVDLDYFTSSEEQFDTDRIIFTGNMPYFANYDAVLFFVLRIFPKILKKIPKAKFYIVGQKPPRRVRNLASSNIFVTGFVNDIKTEYLKSAVNVAPMRFGAGTLNKIIESIALGVPVVTTSIGATGLPLELQKYIFVSDDVDEFANLIVMVMKKSEIRFKLYPEAKKKLRELLDWSIIVKEFGNELKQLVKSKVDYS